MMDVHAAVYEYEGHADSRSQTSLDPKLRGWRINGAEQARKLARVLRRKQLKALRASLDYSEAAPYVPAKHSKPLRVKQQLRREFLQHMEKWRADTSFLSSIQQKTAHPSYLQIIAMGEEVLPLIFEQMEKRPGHWFTALYAITRGENPVPNADAGLVGKMTDHWLRWARMHGYLR